MTKKMSKYAAIYTIPFKVTMNIRGAFMEMIEDNQSAFDNLAEKNNLTSITAKLNAKGTKLALVIASNQPLTKTEIKTINTSLNEFMELEKDGTDMYMSTMDTFVNEYLFDEDDVEWHDYELETDGFDGYLPETAGFKESQKLQPIDADVFNNATNKLKNIQTKAAQQAEAGLKAADFDNDAHYYVDYFGYHNYSDRVSIQDGIDAMNADFNLMDLDYKFKYMAINDAMGIVVLTTDQVLSDAEIKEVSEIMDGDMSDGAGENYPFDWQEFNQHTLQSIDKTDIPAYAQTVTEQYLTKLYA